MVNVLTSSVVDRGFVGGIMVSVLASSEVDRGFEPRSGQTKDYEIDICCFSTKDALLRRNHRRMGHGFPSPLFFLSLLPLFFFKMFIIIPFSKFS